MRLDLTFAYPAEKFTAARRSLMLPHPRGEAASIADAFHECSLGLHKLDRDSLDDGASAWIRTLEALMDTYGLTDEADLGLWHVKAKNLTDDEKLDLSDVVDELAFWFRREHFSAN